MSAIRSVPTQDGYVITEKGREDLHTSGTCACQPHLAGLLIECPECGTVYGTLRDSLNWGTGRNGVKF